MAEDEKVITPPEPTPEPPPDDTGDTQVLAELSQDEKDFREFVGVDDKAKTDPAWDNKRFRSIYRKSKDLERKVGEKDSDIALMREHNKALFESVNKITESTSSLIENETKRRTSAIENEITSIENKIDTLKGERSKARKEADFDEIDRLDGQIDKVKDALQAKRQQVVEKTLEKAPKAAPVDPDLQAIDNFAKECPWFQYGNEKFTPRMAADAKEYDTHLMNMEKWKGRPISERLQAVKEKIETDYNWKTAKSDNGRKVGGSEGVGREGPPTTPTDIELTDDQKRTARLMFPDKPKSEAEKIYAKEVKFIQGRA